MGKKPIHFGDRKGLSRRELFRLAGATGASLAIALPAVSGRGQRRTLKAAL